MVIVKLTNYQARKLKLILKSDLKEYERGIDALEELDVDDPKTRIGKSGLLPKEAVLETRLACSVLQSVIDQLKKEKN